MQYWLGASVWFGKAPQPLELSTVKSPAFAPVVAIEVSCVGAFPVFVTVKYGALLDVLPTGVFAKPKIRFENARLCVATAPFPPRKIICGDAVLVSVTERYAVRGDPAAGLKAMVTVHDAPAAKLPAFGQELAEIEKSPALFPPR